MQVSELSAVNSQGGRRYLEPAERVFRLLIEIPAACMILAEICVLFCGVVARYAFDRPLIWSDEVATLIFLWLSMFGSVIALMNGEHMRLSAIV